MKRLRVKIGTKIIWLTEMSALVITVMATIVVLVAVDGVFKQQAFSKMQTISQLKETNIDNFLNEVTAEIEFFNNRRTVRRNLIDFLGDNNLESKVTIDDRADELLFYMKDFLDISVIDKSGLVVYSSVPDNEGKIRDDQPYFFGAKNATFIQEYTHDIDAEKSVIKIGTPIKNNDGDFLGVLAATINVNQIGDLIGEKIGLGETGETFLINSSNLVVTDLAKQSGAAMRKTIYDPEIKSCLNGNSVNFENADYSGDMVYGYLRWIPRIKSCMVTKIDVREVLDPSKSIVYAILTTFLIGGLITGIIGYIVSRRIVRPVSALRESMNRVKSGDYDIQDGIDTNDEIGEMAKTFTEMALRLKTLYSGLENKVKEKTADLESKVEELDRMNKLMVDRELRMVELKKELEKKNG